MALTKITPQMFDTSATAHDLNVDNGTFVVDGSASRVGIGTATPSTLLDVNGTATATTFVGALTGNVTGNVSGTAATVTGAAQTNITSLGTLSALTVSGTLTGSDILLNDSGNNERSLRIQNSTVSSYLGVEGSSANRFVGSAANNMFLGTTTADGIEFATNNTVRAVIDSSGSVGIGTALASSMNAGANQLVVGSGSAGQGITLYSSTTTAGSIHFADGTSGNTAYRGQLVYNHNSDYMAMYTSATEAMRIDNNGQVGIGKTPIRMLDIKDYGSGDPGIRLESASQSMDVITLRNADGRVGFGGDAITVLQNGNVGIGTTGAGVPLHIASTSQARLALDTTAGNTRRFDIVGDSNGFTIRDQSAAANRMTISTSGTATFTGASSASLQVIAPTDNAFISLYGGYNDSAAEEAGITLHQNQTAKWQIANTTGNDFRIYNYATSSAIFTIAPSGHATFASRINFANHIIGSANGGYLQVRGTGDRYWAIGSTGGANSPTTASATLGFHHYDGSSWTQNKVNITASGKLGLGTDNPDTELHVFNSDSGATATGNTVATFESNDNTEVSILGGSSSVLALNFGHSGDNNEGLIYFNTTAGSENMQLDSSKDITFRNTAGNGPAGKTYFKAYNTDIMTVDGSTNRVGIGKTSPSSKLHVVSTGSASYSGTSSGSNIALYLVNEESGAANRTVGMGLVCESNGEIYLNAVTNSINNGADFYIATRHAGTRRRRFQIMSDGRQINQNAAIVTTNEGFVMNLGFIPHGAAYGTGTASGRYLHMKLTQESGGQSVSGTNVMGRYEYKGFAYGGGFLHSGCSFYTYSGTSSPYAFYSYNQGHGNGMSAYYSSDNKVVIVVDVVANNYSGGVLYFQSGSTHYIGDNQVASINYSANTTGVF